jgi:two-component system response regulator YesN
MIADRSGENAICFSIEEFVRQNFQNESLSVKTISDHVNRSTSYVCTVFKNETGMTLNQFITKCRMEKAKEMLTDPRYKITDIASRVGYLDVNYFGKILKKYSGVTPSDYRGTLVK